MPPEVVEVYRDTEPSVVEVVMAPAVVEVVEGGQIGPPGPQGAPGPPGEWVSMTQAEFDALPVKDPGVLYVIVG